MPLTTYTSGEVLTAASLNANFSFAAGGAPMAIFNETQASGTQAGTFTSGSYVKRVLNTTVINDITGCSIASSVITLPAGTYFVSAIAPALQVSSHKIRLQNTTDSTTIAISTNANTQNAVIVQTNAVLNTYFTLAASKNIELQHRCAVTQATYGLGTAATFGDNEVYSSITITKVA
jgi:hypothetical protein